jgi:ATP-dependent protease HslVU (ClpYQ) peptidase subunit
MTCVIGIIDNDRVFIGGDSAAVAGWTRRRTLLQKVFRRGPFLIGYTTSFRMGQLLEHQLLVPKQDDRESNMGFMVNKFIEATRALLKERGFSKIESNNESGGKFMVGYRGRLYSIESDFQVGEMAEGFDAIGSGSEFALGAMSALNALPPKRRILRSLEIASEYNMGVCAPFVVKSIRAS